MVRTPAALISLTGIAFLALSFVPEPVGGAPSAPSQAPTALAPAKGDRMAVPAPAGVRATVSTVELIGVSQATVILRDRDGKLLYRADPQAGITTFSKNTELPVITLKEEPRSPVVEHPVSRREGTEVPQERKQKRRNPVGCLGDVSPLARASADRMPSLCLAALDQALS